MNLLYHRLPQQKITNNGNLGEQLKLPQSGPGHNPGCKHILWHFCTHENASGDTILFVTIFL